MTAACATTPTTTGPPVYEAWADVDPHTHPNFIALEPAGLAASQGERRLYGLGVGVCRNLDRGNTVAQEVAGLIDQAGLVDRDTGALVGSAVANLCPHHTDAVEAYARRDG